MKIVFFGTPEFAVPNLKILLDSAWDVSTVVTQPDRRTGRGRQVKPCPVKREAEKAGLSVLQPEWVKDRKFIDELILIKPSVIVVVAYGQILPPEIIHFPEYGCVNVHASLLPKYRGAAPISRAIIEGEEKTGITTMLMDEGMDTGPVLIMEEVGIKPDETAGELAERLSLKGAELIVPTLEGLMNGGIRPEPQTGEPSYAPLLKKSDGLLQWTEPANALNNFIRGMNPWPGAFSFLQGERVKILGAAPVDGAAEAGVIMTVHKDALIVGTGKGMLSILEIQAPGKPAMPVKAFLQGRKIEQGMRFNNPDD